MHLPDTLSIALYIPIVFVAIVLYTIFQLHLIFKKAGLEAKTVNLITTGIVLWTVIQSILALNNFYSTNTMTTPPRFLIVFAPILLAILALFLSKKGRAIIDSLPLLNITWLNIVRIPVEFCLYWLFLESVVPELMTFSGRNFDILAGLTAPIIAYWGLQKKQISSKVILIWNIISLGLLLFIVFNGLLSAPTALQQFAMEEPNIALLYFPFVLLPGLVVPAVLFGHFVSIYQLTRQ